MLILNCLSIDKNISFIPWREKLFYAIHPFGKPICFVNENPVFSVRRVSVTNCLYTILAKQRFNYFNSNHFTLLLGGAPIKASVHLCKNRFHRILFGYMGLVGYFQPPKKNAT
jgi:hypothetical protein